ncbi:DUF2815 family protein [Clostridium sp. KNHs216]|uniref:DUF2815 family protein n=1 Tax=Clostridium sp. KNHs216 TaxID=1550235 RepID=UPI001153CA74|nr:DUF2815 family protein [Clostridium sp. KNHs216]TQI66238.1 uncharacterized protein DUF2815 [Clostridium sp. KNHs216]
MSNTNTAHIVLRNVRLSYTHLDKPYASQPGQEPKYSATVLVPKNPANNRALIDAAAAAATQKAIEKYGKAFPAMPKVSVHDGDGVRPSDGQPFGDECKGCWVFTASSKTPVKIVDLNLQDILDATQIYSGMYANVGVTFFGYNAPQNKGIGVALDNVQKTADGEPLGSQRASAEDDFGGAEPQVSVPYIPPYPQAPAAPQYPQYTQQPAAPAYPQYAQAPAQPYPDMPQGYPQYPAVDPITGAPLTR